jgi:hypothetical protein
VPHVPAQPKGLVAFVCLRSLFSLHHPHHPAPPEQNNARGQILRRRRMAMVMVCSRCWGLAGDGHAAVDHQDCPSTAASSRARTELTMRTETTKDRAGQYKDRQIHMPCDGDGSIHRDRGANAWQQGPSPCKTLCGGHGTSGATPPASLDASKQMTKDFDRILHVDIHQANARGSWATK